MPECLHGETYNHVICILNLQAPVNLGLGSSLLVIIIIMSFGVFRHMYRQFDTFVDSLTHLKCIATLAYVLASYK